MSINLLEVIKIILRFQDDPEEIEPEINNNDLVKGTISGEELLFQKYSVVFTAPCK